MIDCVIDWFPKNHSFSETSYNNYIHMKCDSPKAKSSKKSQYQSSMRSLSSRRRSTYDRHIRKVDSAKFAISQPAYSQTKSSKSYQSELQQSLFKNKGVRQYTLEKREKSQASKTIPPRLRRFVYPVRKFKVYGWPDNYYSNLMDWSYNNFICAAKGRKLYFYNMSVDDQFEASFYRDYDVASLNSKINSVHFSPASTQIALGLDSGNFLLYDYLRQKIHELIQLHSQRITCVQWDANHIFTSSKDKKIKCMDSRTCKRTIKIPKLHREQVCGLKSRGHYLASGGNDNSVYIYDIRRTQTHLDHYKHQGAVKALDWTIQDMLVSGGGTLDRKIKFWKDGEEIIKSIDTGSQVCGLIASVNSNQIVSCQGFSMNQIIIWDLTGKKTLTVHGHRRRVVYSALSPGGRFVATGAGDQTLQVWNFFQSSTERAWPNSEIR